MRTDRIALEPLESRWMLASYVVTTDVDDASGATDGQVSLREAVIAAETNAAFGDAAAGNLDGDTISFSAALTNATIFLVNGQLVVGDDLTIDGGAVNVAIDGQGSSRIFHVDSDAVVQIENMTLLHGETTGNGGAILHAGAGDLILRGLDIQFCQAASGGAVASTGARVWVFDSTFASNVATAGGGALHVSGSNGTVTRIFGGVFDANQAADGGGLWNQSGSTLIVRGATLTGNVSSGGSIGAGGGAVFNNGGITRIIGSTLRGNLASGTEGSGGAILSTGGILNVRSSSQIVGNQAVRAGGGIEIVNGYARIDDSAIGTIAEGNLAGGVNANPGNGGGLHTSGNLASTYVLLVNSTVRGNTAAHSGGGLWNQANARLIVRNNTRVEGNVAAGDGVNAGGAGVFNNGGTVRVIGSTVSGNQATGLFASGGGILSLSGVVNIRAQANVAGNTATGLGGGVSVRGGYAQIVDSTIGGAGASDGNEATEGGGVFVTGVAGTVFVIDAGTIEGNVASRSGGGLWAGDNAILLIRNGSVVRSNLTLGIAPTDGGGGVYLAGNAYLGLRSSTVSDNEASGTFASGGGVYIASSAAAEFTSAVVTANATTLNGGGVYNAGFLSSDVGSLITLNVADSGGGIFRAAGSATLVVVATVFSNTPDNLV